MIAPMDPTPHTTLVLASASPRRRRLFALLDLPYTCVATDTDEDLDSPLAREPRDLVEKLAADKALAAQKHGARGIVAAFDTVVVHDSRVLGKPADLAEAHEMLDALSGGTHHVATGIALLAEGESVPLTFAVVTPVRMKALTPGVVAEWVAKGELLGCAGAYNIESHLAEVDLDQCYQNVAGIPLCHLYAELCALLGRLGEPLPASPVARCDAARQVRCVLGPRVVAGAGCPQD